MKHPWNRLETPWKHHSISIATLFKHCWNTFERPLKHPRNTLVIFGKHPWNYLATIFKHLWKHLVHGASSKRSKLKNTLNLFMCLTISFMVVTVLVALYMLSFYIFWMSLFVAKPVCDFIVRLSRPRMGPIVCCLFVVTWSCPGQCGSLWRTVPLQDSQIL